jgi:hypothetical protein
MSGAQVGMIVGAGVIGAALINNQDKTEVGPLSSGARRL